MSDWLASLPHQIPFRAVSEAEIVDESTIRGVVLVTANDALGRGTAVLSVMLVEAMAQIAGTLVFGRSGAPGYLSGIDDVALEHEPEPGDAIEISSRLEGSFGALHRFRGEARLEGREIGRAKFYLASPERG